MDRSSRWRLISEVIREGSLRDEVQHPEVLGSSLVELGGVAMSEYVPLSLDERFAIARLRECGWSKRSIARELDRSPSTIKRELERNSNVDGGYRLETVEARYLARRAKSLLLDRLEDLASFVVERLTGYRSNDWSRDSLLGGP